MKKNETAVYKRCICCGNQVWANNIPMFFAYFDKEADEGTCILCDNVTEDEFFTAGIWRA